MIDSQTRESRPAGNWAAEDLADTPTVAAATDDDLDAAHVFFRTSYAVLVRGKSVRRHVYLNLPAAERAVQRAHARGDFAELILVRLVPVDARHLDDVGRPRLVEVRRDENGHLVPNVLPDGPVVV